MARKIYSASCNTQEQVSLSLFATATTNCESQEAAFTEWKCMNFPFSTKAKLMFTQTQNRFEHTHTLVDNTIRIAATHPCGVRTHIYQANYYHPMCTNTHAQMKHQLRTNIYVYYRDVDGCAWCFCDNTRRFPLKYFST